jgi:SAM-dependent methyltransferase
MDLRGYVLSQLPPAPARVLEIGCGDGALSLALAAAGYEVIGVDPAAPEGEIFRRVPFEQYRPEGAFQAVVASSALHHLPDLGAALDTVAASLERGGALILDEFAWDRLDRDTATWLYAQRRVQAARGGPSAPATIDALEEEWRRHHEDLHGFERMRTELDARFRERLFEWAPYLYRYFEDRDLREAEREAIEQSAIRAIGFRYVGER